MKLSELMTKHTPDPSFEGFVTNDDMVLAVDISGGKNTDPGSYVVVQMGISGLDAQNNPVTVDKKYIRAGQSTTKTGNQRSFKVSGDRYVGDPFQDYACSPKIMQGVGQTVVVPYVYFCVLNGKGEKGTVSIITNSDASGSAGENAGIDIELKKVAAAPVEWTYEPAPSGTDGGSDEPDEGDQGEEEV